MIYLLPGNLRLVIYYAATAPINKFMNLKDFTFAGFYVEHQDQLAQKMLSEVNNVPADLWYYDEFRNCSMLSVFNPGGLSGKVDMSSKEEFKFTDAATLCPVMTQFLSDNVLSWMRPLGRVTILRTPALTQMNTHIDCSEKESQTRVMDKWRFVLSGDIDKLYFLDDGLRKVYIPSNYRCYILDGGHPHCIETSPIEKITICIGSPWEGDLTNSEYIHYLETAAFKMKVSKSKIDQQWINPRLRK